MVFSFIATSNVMLWPGQGPTKIYMYFSTDIIFLSCHQNSAAVWSPSFQNYTKKAIDKSFSSLTSDPRCQKLPPPPPPHPIDPARLLQGRTVGSSGTRHPHAPARTAMVRELAVSSAAPRSLSQSQRRKRRRSNSHQRSRHHSLVANLCKKGTLYCI